MKKIFITFLFITFSLTLSAKTFRDDNILISYVEGLNTEINTDASEVGLKYKLSNDLIIGLSYSKITAESLSESITNSTYSINFSDTSDIGYLLRLDPGIVELVGTFVFSDGNVTVKDDNQSHATTDLKEYSLMLGFRAAINNFLHIHGAFGHSFLSLGSSSIIPIGIPNDDFDFRYISGEYFINDDYSSQIGFFSDGSFEKFEISLKKYF